MIAWFLLATLVTAGAPEPDPADRHSRVGESCTRTQDCAAPLRCVQQVCRSPSDESTEPPEWEQDRWVAPQRPVQPPNPPSHPTKKPSEGPDLAKDAVRIRTVFLIGVDFGELTWKTEGMLDEVLTFSGRNSPTLGGQLGVDVPIPGTDLVTLGAAFTLAEHPWMSGGRMLSVGASIEPTLRVVVGTGWLELYLRAPIGFESTLPDAEDDANAEYFWPGASMEGAVSFCGGVLFGASFMFRHVGLFSELGFTYRHPVVEVVGGPPAFELGIELNQLDFRIGFTFLP